MQPTRSTPSAGHAPRKSLRIHEDIRKARLPEAEFYNDEAWFQLQRDQIFTRAWQLISHTKPLEGNGKAMPVTLLPGLLDVPLILTRSTDGQVRCLSNVCTHRGARLLDKAGNHKSLRCGYHGRCFSLEGKCLSAPGYENTPGFPGASDNLPSLPLERWSSFLFTRLKEGIPFQDWLGPLEARVGFLPLETLVFEPSSSRTYEVDAHWALYCDNYLEGLHVPFVHKGLAQRLDQKAYEYELFDWGSLQVGIGVEGERTFELPPGHPDSGRAVAAFWFWLFPNLMLNFYPWGLSVNVVDAVNPMHTRIRYLTYVWKDKLQPNDLLADLQEVELEDEEVVQKVAQGLTSPLYRPGRYSPSHEKAVHHFHRLVERWLAREG